MFKSKIMRKGKSYSVYLQEDTQKMFELYLSNMPLVSISGTFDEAIHNHLTILKLSHPRLFEKQNQLSSMEFKNEEIQNETNKN